MHLRSLVLGASVLVACDAGTPGLGSSVPGDTGCLDAAAPGDVDGSTGTSAIAPPGDAAAPDAGATDAGSIGPEPVCATGT